MPGPTPGPTLTPIPGGRAQRPARAGRVTAAGPLLTAHDGDNMSADDAAWASIADAAERALMLPGLSPREASEIRRLRDGSLLAAGLGESGVS